jgi:hypothetical protein
MSNIYSYYKNDYICGNGKYIGNNLGSKSSNEMVILSGSKIPKTHSIKMTNGRYKNVINANKELRENDYLNDKGEFLVLIKDYVCSCPNVAACLLSGKIVTDGNINFKNSSGISLRDLIPSNRKVNK